MYGDKFYDATAFAGVVDNVIRNLRPIDFDVVVFRGFSGAVVGPVVALKMGKNWAFVRKHDDNSHSSSRIEGSIIGRYVIVDDFIDSGATIRKIIEDVSYTYPDAVCLGAFFYDQSWHSRAVAGPYKDLFEDKLHGLTSILNWQPPASHEGTKKMLERRLREWVMADARNRSSQYNSDRPRSIDPEDWRIMVGNAESGAFFDDMMKRTSQGITPYLAPAGLGKTFGMDPAALNQ
jgi:hypothetical protein